MKTQQVMMFTFIHFEPPKCRIARRGSDCQDETFVGEFKDLGFVIRVVSRGGIWGHNFSHEQLAATSCNEASSWRKILIHFPAMQELRVN